MHAPAKMIHGQQIHAAVAHYRGGGELVEGPLQTGPRGPALGGAPPRAHACAGAVGGVREVEQVGPFGVIELQGTGDRVEDQRPDAGRPTTLELAVVLDADPRQ